MWMPESGQFDSANPEGGNPASAAPNSAAPAAAAPSAKELEAKPRPSRPLSAYNLFFQAERKSMLDVLPVRAKGKPRHSHGKIGFADLARKIAAKWKALTKEEREPFDEQAAAEKKRYAKELKVWKREQEEAKQAMRREHELLVQARTGLMVSGGAVGMNPAMANARSPTASGVLQLPSTTMINRGVPPVQAFDDHPGMNMQHPYQQMDPAMLSNNTAPRFLDTSTRAWNANTNQNLQQQALLQDAALARSMGAAGNMGNAAVMMGGMGGSMGNTMAGMVGSGADFGLTRQDFANQMGMGGNAAAMANQASDLELLRQYAGTNMGAATQNPFAGFPEQGTSPLAQLRNSQQARFGAGMDMGGQFATNSQLAAARMGNMDLSGRGGTNFANPAAQLRLQQQLQQQQLQQQQQQQNPGGSLTADEMERYLRDRFG